MNNLIFLVFVKGLLVLTLFVNCSHRENSNNESKITVVNDSVKPGNNYKVHLNNNLYVLSSDTDIFIKEDTIYRNPQIFFNSKLVYSFEDNVIYLNKDRIIHLELPNIEYLVFEEFEPIGGNIFHVLTMQGGIVKVHEAKSNYHGDLDNDSFIELGGIRRTEVVTDNDSVYYQSCTIYELGNDGIVIDTLLTRKYTIDLIGFYAGISNDLIFIPKPDSLK